MNKKFILGLGALTAVVAPVAAVISCKNDKPKPKPAAPKTSLATDLAKFSATATSAKDKAALTTDIGSKAVGAAITPAELGITAPTLSTGVTATFKVAEKYADGKVIVTVTLAKTGVDAKNLENNTKNIIVFAKDAGADIILTAELEKFGPSATSTKDKPALKTAVGTKDVDATVTKDELGYAEPALSTGVTATYKIKNKYDDGTGRVVVEVTLKKGTDTKSKQIRITAKADAPAKADLTTDLAKFSATATSAKDKAALKTAIGTKDVDATVTKDELGYAEPALSTGVTATYKVKTKYEDSTGKVVVTVTLAKTGVDAANTTNNTKEITITAKADAPAAVELKDAVTFHSVFHKAGGRSLPAVGQALSVKVSDAVTETYTWTQADTDSAVAKGFNKPKAEATKSQRDILAYLADKMVASYSDDTDKAAHLKALKDKLRELLGTSPHTAPTTGADPLATS